MTQIKKLKNKLTPVLLIVFQIAAGIFLPMEISFSPLEVSLNQAEAAGEAWLSGWSYRKPVVLTGGASGAQTAFQLDIAIAHVAGKIQSDFDDIRFTQADGVTLIDAWLESKVDDTSAETWVEFPTTPANTVEQTYYMYYGKADAASNWDGADVFISFLNFENTIEGFSAGTSVTTQAKHDSYSLQLASAGNNKDMSFPAKPYSNIFWIYPTLSTQLNRFFLSWGNVKMGVLSVGYPTAGNFGYYDTAWHDFSPVVSVTANTWTKIEFIILSDTAYTIKINDAVAGSSLAYYSYANGDRYQYIDDDANNMFVDGVLLRKYIANPPTYAFGAEEQGVLEITSPALATLAGKTVSTASQTSTGVIGDATHTNAVGVKVADDRPASPGWTAVITSTHFTTRATTKELVDADTDNTVDFTGTYDGLDGVLDPNGTFKVEIDGAGARGAATFDWWDPAGNQVGNAVATAATVVLSNGVTVTFDDTAYSVGDKWSCLVDVFPYTGLTVTPSVIYAESGVLTGVTVGSGGALSGTGATSGAKTLITATAGNGTGIYWQDEDLSLTVHANSLLGNFTATATLTAS